MSKKKKEKTTKTFNDQVTIPSLLAAGSRGEEQAFKGCHCQATRDSCPELLGESVPDPHPSEQARLKLKQGKKRLHGRLCGGDSGGDRQAFPPWHWCPQQRTCGGEIC